MKIKKTLCSAVLVMSLIAGTSAEGLPMFGRGVLEGKAASRDRRRVQGANFSEELREAEPRVVEEEKNEMVVEEQSALGLEDFKTVAESPDFEGVERLVIDPESRKIRPWTKSDSKTKGKNEAILTALKQVLISDQELLSEEEINRIIEEELPFQNSIEWLRGKPDLSVKTLRRILVRIKALTLDDFRSIIDNKNYAGVERLVIRMNEHTATIVPAIAASEDSKAEDDVIRKSLKRALEREGHHSTQVHEWTSRALPYQDLIRTMRRPLSFEALKKILQQADDSKAERLLLEATRSIGRHTGIENPRARIREFLTNRLEHFFNAMGQSGDAIASTISEIMIPKSREDIAREYAQAVEQSAQEKRRFEELMKSVVLRGTELSRLEQHYEESEEKFKYSALVHDKKEQQRRDTELLETYRKTIEELFNKSFEKLETRRRFEEFDPSSLNRIAEGADLVGNIFGMFNVPFVNVGGIAKVISNIATVSDRELTIGEAKRAYQELKAATEKYEKSVNESDRVEKEARDALFNAHTLRECNRKGFIDETQQLLRLIKVPMSSDEAVWRQWAKNLTIEIAAVSNNLNEEEARTNAYLFYKQSKKSISQLEEVVNKCWSERLGLFQQHLKEFQQKSISGDEYDRAREKESEVKKVLASAQTRLEEAEKAKSEWLMTREKLRREERELEDNTKSDIEHREALKLQLKEKRIELSEHEKKFASIEQSYQEAVEEVKRGTQIFIEAERAALEKFNEYTMMKDAHDRKVSQLETAVALHEELLKELQQESIRRVSLAAGVSTAARELQKRREAALLESHHTVTAAHELTPPTLNQTREGMSHLFIPSYNDAVEGEAKDRQIAAEKELKEIEKRIAGVFLYPNALDMRESDRLEDELWRAINDRSEQEARRAWDQLPSHEKRLQTFLLKKSEAHQRLAVEHANNLTSVERQATSKRLKFKIKELKGKISQLRRTAQKARQEGKEEEASSWDEAAAGASWTATYLEKFIEALHSQQPGKEEEAALWRKASMWQQLRCGNNTQAALAWEAHQNNPHPSKENEATSWDQAGYGASCAAAYLEYSIEALHSKNADKEKEAALWREASMCQQLVCENKTRAALAWEAHQNDPHPSKEKEATSWDDVAIGAYLAATYLEHSIEALHSENARKEEEAALWHEASMCQQLVCENKTRAALAWEAHQNDPHPSKEKEATSWDDVAIGAYLAATYLEHSIEALHSENARKEEEAALWCEAAMWLQLWCENKTKAALAWEAHANNPHPSKEKEARSWNEAAAGAYLTATCLEHFIEALNSQEVGKAEEAALWHEASMWQQLRCENFTKAALAWEAHANNPHSSKEKEATSWDATAIGATLTALCLEHSIKALHSQQPGKEKEATSWREVSKWPQLGYKNHTKAALAWEAHGNNPHPSKEKEAASWNQAGAGASWAATYLKKSIEALNSEKPGKAEEAALWHEASMWQQLRCENFTKAALAWEAHANNPHPSKEKEATNWNNAGAGASWAATYLEHSIEALHSEKEDKEEEAALWREASKWAQLGCKNQTKAALAWKAHANNPLPSKANEAKSWNEAARGADWVGWELNFSLRAKERSEGSAMWRQVAKENQSASENWVASAKAYEAGNETKAMQDHQEGWAATQRAYHLLLSYCQHQAEEAAKANKAEEATGWSEAVRLSQLTLACVHRAAAQQRSWKASQSWIEAIHYSKFATHASIEWVATTDQASSDWKKMAHGYEKAAQLRIKAAEAHQAGHEKEGQRFDKEAEKALEKIFDWSKY